MSYYIYGFRLLGDLECRYVGMTSKTPESRLASLTAEAGCRKNWGRKNSPDGLWQWLLNNRGRIETFKIGKVETNIEARAMERAIIALVLQLGHRLLNIQHVPEEKRIGQDFSGWTQQRRRARSGKAAAQ